LDESSVRERSSQSKETFFASRYHSKNEKNYESMNAYKQSFVEATLAASHIPRDTDPLSICDFAALEESSPGRILLDGGEEGSTLTTMKARTKFEEVELLLEKTHRDVSSKGRVKSGKRANLVSAIPQEELGDTHSVTITN
jgi:hypothetical protein